MYIRTYINADGFSEIRVGLKINTHSEFHSEWNIFYSVKTHIIKILLQYKRHERLIFYFRSNDPNNIISNITLFY